MENKELKKLIDKVNEAKKGAKLDLSTQEDLSIAIMNLVSLEEHFFFTAEKTGKNQYFDLLNQIRKMRKELLAKIVKQTEGEVWCISKHLLAASMRLMEVATKELSSGHKKSAEDLFKKSFDLYSLFWAINLKLVTTSHIKKIDNDKINIHDKGSGFLDTIGNLVKRALDCCKE